MKFLVDAQLPVRLARLLKAAGHDPQRRCVGANAARTSVKPWRIGRAWPSRSVASEPGHHALHRRDERRQIVVDGCLDDVMGGVEVAMGELVTHSRHVSPRDLGLSGQEVGGDVLDRFADLDETHSNGVEDEAVIETSAL